MRPYKLSLAVVLLMVAFCLRPSVAHADGEGFYLIGSTGAMIAADGSIQDPTTLDPNYSAGLGVGGGIGYELPTLPVRIAAEAMYGSNDLEGVSDSSRTVLSANRTLPGTGSEKLLTGMANAYVFLPSRTIEPYIGAGFGYVLLDFDKSRGGDVSLIDGSANTYAYQFIAGIAFDFIPEPINLGVQYRYRALAETHISGTAGSLDAAYRGHSAMAQIRYSF